MLSLQLPKRDERGFTLIELLVVIIIIGILAAIAIPLFLDQRKLAVDASVKSDVRNTATQVQTWQATNQGVVATDATDYASKGGNVSKSTGNTVKLSVATDGSYLVCGYATGAGKNYTATTAAYVYDSSTGRFGTGDCATGVVGAGSPSSSAPVGITGGVVNGVYSSSFETGDPTIPMWSIPVGTDPGVYTTKGHNSNNSLAAAWTTGNVVVTQFNPNPAFNQTKTYNISAWVYVTAATTVRLGEYKTGAGNVLATSDTVLAPNTWTQLSLTAPGTAVALGNVNVIANQTNNANTGTVYIDDVVITTTN